MLGGNILKRHRENAETKEVVEVGCLKRNTKSAAAQNIDRLNAGTMPTGGKTINDSDKAILIKFLTP